MFHQFFALSAGSLLAHNQNWEIQVTKTSLREKKTIIQGFFGLPVFPLLISESWEPVDSVKMVNMNKIIQNV